MTTRIATRASGLDFDREAARTWAAQEGPAARLAYEVAAMRANGAAWRDVRFYLRGTERGALVGACALARTLPVRFPVEAREEGFYVTVYVAGPASQGDAERLVGEMLDAATPADGLTADVVPE